MEGQDGEANANAIGDWLAADPARRLAGIEALWGVFYTQKGEARSQPGLVKIDPITPPMSNAWANASAWCARWPA
jgi:ATP-dependent helicase/nuclease subunit A